MKIISKVSENFLYWGNPVVDLMAKIAHARARGAMQEGTAATILPRSGGLRESDGQKKISWDR
ncbi:hypothetical protein N6L24_09470 [Cognatishimia sp. SS12]|uniref:hypothetical protein n=1 Tax=Cognatishimia sp. SS12 TaxID=2979465 RepID=UPI002330FB2D|nr:hypothetical protein [Cognatishimia sp. SS12]MDC0738509.1 hypothetical protein [Cognatishimia sp. SS12]